MKLSQIVIIIAGVILLALFIFLAWYPGQLTAGLLLMAFWPGYALLAALWPNDEGSPFSRLGQVAIGVAASYSLTITLLLLMAFAGMPLNRFSVTAGLVGLTLVFGLVMWRRGSPVAASASSAKVTESSKVYPLAPALQTRSAWAWLIIILLVAGLFRVVNVGYSDHQGDEADILLRAVAVVHGEVEPLLSHSKGPGEILLLDGIGALTGRFDEQTVRLLFSIAGAVSVGLIFLLGVLLFDSLVGVIAGLLAAIDGVFVSYARTAQYQSVVLLLTLAAIYCFYRFYQSGGPSRRLHALGTFLLAVSFLVHFETVLLLPVVVYLTLAPARKHLIPDVSGLASYVSRLASLWPSILIFVTLTTIFYVPFLLHPKVGATGTYLENRIGGGETPPFNNLAHFFYFEALKYNSAYYVILFNVFLLFTVAVILLTTPKAEKTEYRFLPRSSAPLLLCLGSIGLGLILAIADFQKLAALFIALGFAAFFLLVIFSPQTSPPERTLWLWLAPPFWIYVFLVNRPGKHHYIFLGALTLLVSLAVIRLWRWATSRWSILKQPTGRRLVVSLGIVLLLIFAGHTVMVLLRSDLEYVLTYPEHKSSFYPTDSTYPYGTRIGFGYPFRLGWQVVGRLKRTGQLAGTWAGNDAGNAPNWYMLNTPQTPCYPDYVFRGETTYKGDDKFDVPFEPDQFGYVPRYRIWGNDRLRLTILAFDPLAGEVEPLDLTEADGFAPAIIPADYATNLATSAAPESPPAIVLAPALTLGEGSEIKNNAPAEYLERAQTLQGRVALVGYDLDQRYAVPGSIIPITLHWRVQNLLSLRYKVFVHLIGPDGQLWAQADDFPVCGTFHVNAWGLGSTVRDRHLLKLPPDLAPGDYTLVVGMYEPDLNLRLNFFDIANNEQGNSLTAGTVTIRPE